MRVKIRGADDFLDVGQPVDYTKLMTQASRRGRLDSYCAIMAVIVSKRHEVDGAIHYGSRLPTLSLPLFMNS